MITNQLFLSMAVALLIIWYHDTQCSSMTTRADLNDRVPYTSHYSPSRRERERHKLKFKVRETHTTDPMGVG